MIDRDRHSDRYDPGPADRPTLDEVDDEYRPPARDDAWVHARYRQTCEDRGYACCDLTPPGEEPAPDWYDLHVEAWLKTQRP